GRNSSLSAPKAPVPRNMTSQPASARMRALCSSGGYAAGFVNCTYRMRRALRSDPALLEARRLRSALTVDDLTISFETRNWLPIQTSRNIPVALKPKDGLAGGSKRPRTARLAHVTDIDEELCDSVAAPIGWPSLVIAILSGPRSPPKSRNRGRPRPPPQRPECWWGRVTAAAAQITKRYGTGTETKASSGGSPAKAPKAKGAARVRSTLAGGALGFFASESRCTTDQLGQECAATGKLGPRSNTSGMVQGASLCRSRSPETSTSNPRRTRWS